MLVTDAGSPSGRGRRSSAHTVTPAMNSAAETRPIPTRSAVDQKSDNVTPAWFEDAGTRFADGRGNVAPPGAVAPPAVRCRSLAVDAALSHPSVTGACDWTVASLDRITVPDPCGDATCAACAALARTRNDTTSRAARCANPLWTLVLIPHHGHRRWHPAPPRYGAAPSSAGGRTSSPATAGAYPESVCR
jgi:hypothetical protein